jgi:hypothetical protein
MNKFWNAAGALLAMSLLVASFTLQATAECGRVVVPHKSGSLQLPWTQGEFLPASFKQVSNADGDGIVGMWKVSFVSGGVEIDHGFAQWHSDGTECMNSGGLSPATQNYCLGVWKSVNGVYRLNHFAFTYDLNGNPTGTANIREQVRVGHPSNTFSGPFTIDLSDLSGNLLVHVEGTVTGTRINVDTPPSQVF